MASHLWIGGATDAGKTTVARRLALVHTLALFECDRRDAAEHARIADASPAYRAFLEMDVEARWVATTPEWLLHNTLASFAERFPLILDSVRALERRGRPVLAEGWDLTPDLVAPHLDDPRRAVWLIPTPDFKRRSWAARDKPSFKREASDPERATENAFSRDLLLGEEIARQAAAHGFDVMIVDGSQDEAALFAAVQARFARFLES